MSATKTVSVDVNVSDVDCEECGKTATTALCDRCLEMDRDRAHDEAIANYSPPAEETRESNSSAVRDWLTKERLKIASDITPEIAAIFERCADDLEVG